MARRIRKRLRRSRCCLARVYIDSTALTIYAVWGYDTDGNQKPDVTEPTEKPNLINVVPPAAITVENGTAIEEMGLPTQVTIQTTKGDMQANVTWDTQNTSYDPSKQRRRPSP